MNDLALVPDDLALVLDDYRVITSPAVNGAVTFLLENLPPNLHLVISSRADPPIPVARLRSRGQVVEVRADELRFTPDEAADFFRQTMGLTLSPEQAAALAERAEGWIAGLQMAALSMRGREDVDTFIQAFAGTNRFILDFLVEEVLLREPEEVQAFLLQTAILTRLSGPLCDAVTGRADGQQMLERLERRNLFVVPLDDHRGWYRYHHLFGDLLQARLHQSGDEPVAQLLSRAAEWCERDGHAAEAVGYAFAARDYTRAAGLVARYWATGEIETAWSWLGVEIELRILRSLALWRRGAAREAEADLQRGLALAEPEGYVRIFVNEGEPLAQLLHNLAAHPARTSESSRCSAGYLATLLAAFGASAGLPSSPGRAVTSPAPGRADLDASSGRSPALIEPLSTREMEVLRLMAEGLTNEQIAGSLIIALGTVKAHIHNISGKLGAQNRTHAVARAKELGLL